MLAIKDDPAKMSILKRAEELALLRDYLVDGEDPIELGRIRAQLRGLR